jgi:hypothetical protein
MDGGGVAASDATTVAAWRRDDTVYLTTNGATARGGPEVRLGPGRDPAIARRGDAVDVAWTEAGGVRLLQSGRPLAGVVSGRFPAILAMPAHTLLAVEDRGAVRVERIAR